ncbi:MAG: hypothetical protein GVY28_05060, partial [Alphaproteobacteria bacterium]|nr:hypothetical protein [Alphaproteobacteria bacterium]
MDAATDAPRGVLETRDVSPAALARRLRADVLHSGRIAPVVAAAGRGGAYVLPWRDKEPVLTGGGRAPVPTEAEETRAFLAHVPTGAQLFYGYPLMVDADGRLAPLLFTSVVVRREAGDRPTVAIAPGWKVRVNHRPLARAGFDAEARERLVDALEHGSFSGLRGFLDHAAGLLGLDLRFVPDALSAPPDGPLPAGWHDHPALILPETDATSPDDGPDGGPGPAPPGPALRADLDRIAAGGETAAGRTDALEALTTAAPDVRAPTVMPIEPLDVGIGNVPALELAATTPLSAVQAADPATARAFAVDLLAGTVVDGQTVLYVAPDAASLDALEATLAPLLGGAASRMIRLDRPGLRPRSPAPAPMAEPLDGTPPLPSPTLAELADKRRTAGEAAASAERLRAAHRSLADIH